MKGFFITFEGIEGSGKSTQIKLLAQALQHLDYSVQMTREPGEGLVGSQIRQILLSTHTTHLDAMAELFLLEADRTQHVTTVIKPALQKGMLVISDRYADSSLAYQGYARGIPLAQIEDLNNMATGGIFPDLTFIIDLEAEKSLNRSHLRLEQQEMFDLEGRFESEHVSFHQKVRYGYLQIAAKNPDRVVVVDGARDIRVIAEQIRNTTIERLNIQVLGKTPRSAHD